MPGKRPNDGKNERKEKDDRKEKKRDALKPCEDEIG
jgi:hypothetical protein